jgi:nitroimidazol reductase NimA-like FMN-containing flavoprotein (pyridoxamine 5'-phosphate oxidase superfamily)
MRTAHQKAIQEVEAMHTSRMSSAVEAGKAESISAHEKKLRDLETEHNATMKQAMAAKEEEMEEEKRKAVESARMDGQKSGQTSSEDAARIARESGS